MYPTYSKSRHTAVILVILIILALPPSARALQSLPYFTPGDCALPVPGPAECGTLTVLEDRAKPGGRTVTLAVVILKSTSPDPAPDPVVYLEGGPGGSISLGGAGLSAPFLAERDFILMEQRGNTLSDPWLDCPEHDAAFLKMFAASDPPDQEVDGLLAAAATCRDRFLAQGIDLGQYHSTATAADFADLRQVLGFDGWNLYGISYGTRLALTILRDHPAGLRALVLDSVYPPSLKVYEDFPSDYDQSLQVVFDACAADPECSAAYPDFEASYFRAIDRLDADPARVHAAGMDMRFTGGDLRMATYVMLYYPSTISLLPLLSAELNAGRNGLIGPLMESFTIYLEAISEGKWWSSECYEEIALNDLAAVREAERAFPRAPLNFKYRNDFAVCATWGAGRAPASFKEPIVSDVPVLLMAGQMDASTPPRWAEDAARTLTKSTALILPGQGHGVSTYGCGQQIAVAFIHDPEGTINIDCMESISHQTFVVPADWIVTLIPYHLVDTLTAHPQLLVQIVIILMITVSLIELLMAPIAFLRRARHPEQPPQKLARTTRTLATAIALLGLIIVVGLGVALFDILRQNMIYLAVGLPRASTWVLALMPVHALASAVLLGLVVIAWRRGWWHSATRVHVTLLAISGVSWAILIGWAWLG